jgi:hypothetical protein
MWYRSDMGRALTWLTDTWSGSLVCVVLFYAMIVITFALVEGWVAKRLHRREMRQHLLFLLERRVTQTGPYR